MSKASLYFACASNTLRNPGRRSSAALLWACRVLIWGLACRPLRFVFRMILARCPKIPSAQLSPPATRKCLWYILAPFRLPLDCLSRNFLVLAGNFCLLTLEAGVNTLVWWFTPPGDLRRLETIRPAAAPFHALAPSTPRRAEAGVCFWIGPENFFDGFRSHPSFAFAHFDREWLTTPLFALTPFEDQHPARMYSFSTFIAAPKSGRVSLDHFRWELERLRVQVLTEG